MLRARNLAGGVALLGLSLVLASCSSSPSAQNAPSSTTSVASTPSSTSGPSAVNLAVTDAIRSQLVAAGAAVNSIPVSEYSGLAPGLTYYALDKSTGTHWAGARLVPAPSSDPNKPTQAEVASQDEGSYYVFNQPQGGDWTAHPTGNTGPNTPCSVTVPPAVLQVWGWPAGSCRPNGV